MKIDEPDKLFALAEELLFSAERENERSEEDVVTHLICVNSRQSIEKFLTGYLLRELVAIDEPSTLASLLAQCKLLDARFDMLNLEEVHCRFDTDERNYCLEHYEVDACIKVAQNTRSIVMTSSPAY